MPLGGNYKDFLKNNLNKADLIRRLNEFVKREIPRLHLDYSLVITFEKEAWKISLNGVQNVQNIDVITKKLTHALCTITLWRINQQWRLHRILIYWYLWYMYLHVVFSVMTGFYKPRKSSLWMYLRFMVTLVMQLQSRCQQFSSSPAVIQWVTSTVNLELLSDFREYTHLAEASEEKLKRFF